MIVLFGPGIQEPYQSPASQSVRLNQALPVRTFVHPFSKTDLPYSFHLKWSQHRWVLGSADVCFHKFLHQPIKQRLIEWFFCAGKTVPVTHGDGIYQPGIDWAVERLQMGDWVNLYPEGQVNKYNDWMRFYWGIGRMVYEAPKVSFLLISDCLTCQDMLQSAI